MSFTAPPIFPYLTTSLVVVQVHQTAGIRLYLSGVQEATRQPHAVADIDAAPAPLPPRGRHLLPGLVARVTAAVGDVAAGARRRHRVRHPGAAHGVRERCLFAA